MLDVEVELNTLRKYHISKEAFQDSLQVFMELCKDYYGKYPMIYGTNRSYNEICGDRFKGYKLYIGRHDKDRPIVCKDVSLHTIWQFSDLGQLKGISKEVDLCRFDNGNTIEDIIL